jgi:hypothetical protein
MPRIPRRGISALVLKVRPMVLVAANSFIALIFLASREEGFASGGLPCLVIRHVR